MASAESTSLLNRAVAVEVASSSDAIDSPLCVAACTPAIPTAPMPHTTREKKTQAAHTPPLIRVARLRMTIIDSVGHGVELGSHPRSAAPLEARTPAPPDDSGRATTRYTPPR